MAMKYFLKITRCITDLFLQFYVSLLSCALKKDKILNTPLKKGCCCCCCCCLAISQSTLSRSSMKRFFFLSAVIIAVLFQVLNDIIQCVLPFCDAGMKQKPKWKFSNCSIKLLEIAAKSPSHYILWQDTFDNVFLDSARFCWRRF